ncbi:MAG: hypothetical protein WCY62_06940 [Clostridia bacterium]|jgi:hypothetical protein
MEWYWWVLIGVGIVALGFIKIKVWNSIKKKYEEKTSQKEDE